MQLWKVNSNPAIREDLIKKNNRYFYLLASDPGLPKNENFEQLSGKKIFKKVFAVLKLSAFCFKISSFSFRGCCISFILHLLQLVCGSKGWSSFTLQVYD